MHGESNTLNHKGGITWLVPGSSSYFNSKKQLNTAISQKHILLETHSILCVPGTHCIGDLSTALLFAVAVIMNTKYSLKRRNHIQPLYCCFLSLCTFWMTMWYWEWVFLCQLAQNSELFPVHVMDFLKK